MEGENKEGLMKEKEKDKESVSKEEVEIEPSKMESTKNYDEIPSEITDGMLWKIRIPGKSSTRLGLFKKLLEKLPTGTIPAETVEKYKNMTWVSTEATSTLVGILKNLCNLEIDIYNLEVELKETLDDEISMALENTESWVRNSVKKGLKRFGKRRRLDLDKWEIDEVASSKSHSKDGLFIFAKSVLPNESSSDEDASSSESD